MWVFRGKSTGAHPSKLNSSHEKVLDAINPCATCGRMLPEHKDKTCIYQRAAVLEFVLYDLRHTFATRMVEAAAAFPRWPLSLVTPACEW